MATHGTGRRGRAQVWSKLGPSGKQNKMFCKPIDRIRKLACIFGDSQLRGVVQEAVPLPTHPRWQFLVSSTPGGTCGHIELEFKSFVFPCRPDLIVVEAGTNNLRQPVEEAEMEFRHLLRIARKTCEVVAISILPRLDGLGYVVPSFNAAFQRSAREEGASWVDLTDRFPVQELRLWAYDGVHLSDCTGMPRLTAAVAEVCSQ